MKKATPRRVVTAREAGVASDDADKVMFVECVVGGGEEKAVRRG